MGGYRYDIEQLKLGLSPAVINETIDDRVAGLLVAGSGITLTYNDAANTLTITNTISPGTTGFGLMGIGEDGSPGEDATPIPGPQGPQGLQGQVGPAGPAIYLEADQGEQGEQGIPGGQGPAGVGNTGPTGNPGPMGPAVYLDAEGTEGDIGPPGPVGPAGPQGASGFSAGILGLWRTDTTVGGDPASGRLRWDNATEISALNITIDHIDQNNNDIDIFFDLMAVGDRLYIQDQNDSANYQIWTLTGTPTGSHALTYHSLPVSFVTSGGTGTTNFPNNSLVFVASTRPGAIGAQGPIGWAVDGVDGQDSMVPGPPGATGFPGPMGPAVYLDADQGLDGDIGPPGIQGPAGAGSVGPQGVPGVATFLEADAGLDGDFGPPGKDGPAGTTGAPGPMGPAVYLDAEQGIEGDFGPMGLVGPTGPAGPGTVGVGIGGAYVTKTADLIVVLGTPTLVAFDTEVYDDAGYWSSASPSQFFAPVRGWYVVYLHTLWDSTNTRRGAWIYKNTLTPTNAGAVCGQYIAAGVSPQVNCSGLCWLEQGEYVSFIVQTDAGSTLNSTTRWTRAGIVAVGLGMTGPQGRDGEDGFDGEDGSPGQPGRDGSTGAPGPMGPAVYLDAEPGQDGDFIPGPTGPAGPTGATGPAGGGGSSMGPPGQDGADSDDSGWLMGLRDPGATHWADEETIRKKWFFSARAEVNNGSAALPALKFAVADTGFYAGGASNIGVTFSGVMNYEFTSGAFIAHTGEVRANSATTLNAVMRAGANDQNLAVIFGLTYDGTINPYIRGFGGTSATTPGDVQHVTPLTGNTIRFQNAVDGLQFRVGGTNVAEVYRFGAWEPVAGDPPISSYNPGTITIPTEKFAIYASQLKATTTAVVTLQGTSVVRMI